MNSTFSVEDLKRLRDMLKPYTVAPRRVKDYAEAMQMTKADPTGHVWEVGEECYDPEDLKPHK